jgi:hypothetical protein
MGVTRPGPFMPLELTCGAQSRPHIGIDIAAPPGRSVPEIVEGFFWLGDVPDDRSSPIVLADS